MRSPSVRFSATFEYNELSLNRAAEQVAPRLKGILTVADFGSLVVLILLAMALRDQTLLLVIVFLIPAILVALGMFVLQHHVGSFAQLYRRRLDGASYLLVSCGIALVLGKLCVLLLA